MYQLYYRIKTEPALVIQAVSVLISVFAAFGFYSFNDDQTWAILNFVTVVLSLLVGLAVRPFTWPLVMAVVQAVLTLVMQFGLDVTVEQQASVLGAFTVIGAVVVRFNVSPEPKLQALPKPSAELAA